MAAKVLGMVGGIGSGKSFVAGLFAEAGCRVLDADRQVGLEYQSPEVLDQLREWYGPEVVGPGGVNRKALADRVFPDAAALRKLEDLLHDRVLAAFQAETKRLPQPLAVIWDVPLLFEAGWDQYCDACVFVDASPATRLARVQANRKWTEAELSRRQALQMPLSEKRAKCRFVVPNDGDLALTQSHVTSILRLLNSNGDAAS